jgi:ubiquinone/menaquinone biosynthesis C-methylase UbiE
MDITSEVVTIPGLSSGPLAVAGKRLIEAGRTLGDSQAASILRAWCVPHVVRTREAIFDSGEEPVTALVSSIDATTALLQQLKHVGFAELGRPAREMSTASGSTIEAVTGQHYGNLFRGFSPQSYWDEAVQLLRVRLTRNNLDVSNFVGRSVVDAGCGGGRYTGAWRQLGARPALGVDVSPVNVADARARATMSGLTDLAYEEGNVLHLPVPSDSTDIVFSNGVLHHTRDWKQGIAELVRILKPGGFGWLYLIENPGGLFWDSFEMLRELLLGVDHETARRALVELGLPANRIFYMLDHVLVPINIRLTHEEIDTCLRSHGASGIRRLTRGADFDRIERIWKGEPYAVEKFGVGEHRYIFSKD